GMLSRDQLVGDDAPRIDVCPLVRRRIGRRLLGRHVHRRADKVARLGYLGRHFLPRCLDCLGDSEIRDDRRALAEQNGLGLDLAGESRRRKRVGELRWQHLDDDFPAEGFVAGHEHAGHPTRAQFTLYRVVSAPERLLELYEEVVQRFLGAGSLMYAERTPSSYKPYATEQGLRVLYSRVRKPHGHSEFGDRRLIGRVSPSPQESSASSSATTDRLPRH